MKILNWFKEKKENKKKEKEEFFKKIKYRIDNNFKESKTGSFDFKDLMNELVECKKGNYKIRTLSISLLNELVRDLIFNMAFDYKLKEKVHNHLFTDSNGSENTFLSLLFDRIELLDPETIKYVINGFPCNLYKKLLNKNSEDSSSFKISLFEILLKSKDNLLIDIIKNSSIKNILNDNDTILYLGVKISFLTRLSQIIEKNYTYSPNDKIAYIINNLNKDDVDFEERFLEKKLLFQSISKTAPELLYNLKKNEIIQSKDLMYVIPNLLYNYENESDKTKQDEIIRLIKEMMLVKLNIDTDSRYFMLSSALSAKTYNMWFDNFLSSDLTYNQLHGILSNHFNISYHRDLTLIEKYLDKVKNKNQQKEDELIEDLYNEAESEKIMSNLEKYLTYYVDIRKKNLNVDCSWILKHCESDIELNDDKIRILKKFGLDPFIERKEGKSIFEIVDQKTKTIISNVYFKEKSDYEKNLLNKIVNPDGNDVIIKKRL